MVIAFAFADNVCVCGHMETRLYNYIELLDICINVEAEIKSIAVDFKPKHNKPHLIVTEIL